MNLETLLRSIVRAEVGEAMRQILQPQLRDLQEQMAALAADAARPRQEFVTIDQAARVAGFRPKTIRGWIQKGHLTRYRSGRLLRVKLGELHGFLAREADKPAVAAVDIDACADAFLRQSMP